MMGSEKVSKEEIMALAGVCLLYTSDAADEERLV